MAEGPHRELEGGGFVPTEAPRTSRAAASGCRSLFRHGATNRAEGVSLSLSLLHQLFTRGGGAHVLQTYRRKCKHIGSKGGSDVGNLREGKRSDGDALMQRGKQISHSLDISTAFKA